MSMKKYRIVLDKVVEANSKKDAIKIIANKLNSEGIYVDVSKIKNRKHLKKLS